VIKETCFFFLNLKGGAGCSINCKCDDCRNPFGRKGNAFKELEWSLVNDFKVGVLHQISSSLILFGTLVLHKFLP